ncbi:MAG: hypothetical protein KatS3mg105_5009 [Gemmatales bacterium]|nr:MAG: hypothetical protein KatS3mg105_5009 [Gemmatales bacterium]
MSRGVLVLSYRRPRGVRTLGFLRRYGYTGDWRIVCSDDDPTLGEYYSVHSRGRVIPFRRATIECDYCDLLPFDDERYRSVLPARVVAWDVADALGWKRFALFDDDYDSIQLSSSFSSRRYSLHRIPYFLDRLSELFWRWLESMPSFVLGLSMGQTGDRSYERDSFKRKAMNSFYLLTSRRFSWVGRCNEDVSTYFGEQLRGKIFLQVNYLLVHQSRMMSRDGGSTNLYKSLGSDRIKALYSFLQWPGMVRVGYCASVGRCHHKILAHSYPYVVRR